MISDKPTRRVACAGAYLVYFSAVGGGTDEGRPDVVNPDIALYRAGWVQVDKIIKYANLESLEPGHTEVVTSTFPAGAKTRVTFRVGEKTVCDDKEEGGGIWYTGSEVGALRIMENPEISSPRRCEWYPSGKRKAEYTDDESSGTRVGRYYEPSSGNYVVKSTRLCDGVLDGQYIGYRCGPDVSREDGKYRDGHKVGEWTLNYFDGSVFVSTRYDDTGVLDGGYYEKKGDVEVTGYYAAGEKTGTWVERNKEGTRETTYGAGGMVVKEVVTYGWSTTVTEYNTEGVLHGKHVVDNKSSGERGQYNHGIKVGVWEEWSGSEKTMKHYSEEGTLQKTVVYDTAAPNGKLDGPWSELYPDGKYKIRMGYRNGVPVGPYTEFYEDGSPKVEGRYGGRGKEVGDWVYYAQGRKIIKTKHFDTPSPRKSNNTPSSTV